MSEEKDIIRESDSKKKKQKRRMGQCGHRLGKLLRKIFNLAKKLPKVEQKKDIAKMVIENLPCTYNYGVSKIKNKKPIKNIKI